MAVTQTGVAVIWGISSTLAAAGAGLGGAGSGEALRFQSADFDVEAGKIVEIENSQGETIGKIFANQKQNLKIDVIPTADTIAHVKAANIIPKPGTLVTITDTDDTEVSGTNSGKYLCIKASKKKSKDAPLMISMELEQFVDNDITGTIS